MTVWVIMPSIFIEMCSPTLFFLGWLATVILPKSVSQVGRITGRAMGIWHHFLEKNYSTINYGTLFHNFLSFFRTRTPVHMYLALEKPLQRSLKNKFTSPASTTLGKAIFKAHVPVLKEFLQCYTSHQQDDPATSAGCHAFSKLIFQFSFTLCPFNLSSTTRQSLICLSSAFQWELELKLQAHVIHSKRSGIKPCESKID
jgi:hypothetical protein